MNNVDKPGTAGETLASPFTRRNFLRGGVGVAGALSISGLLAACGSSDSGTSSGGGTDVNVLGWADFNVPALSQPSAEARWTPLASTDELYTKSVQTGTFDLLVPASLTARTLIDLDRLQALDESRLSNLSGVSPLIANGDSWARGDDGQLFMSPLLVYWVYSIWDRQQTTQPRTFDDLMNPDLRGKIGVFDDPPTIFILAGLAGAQGQALTDQKLEEVAGMLNQLRPQIATLYPAGGSVNLFARKEIALTIHSYLNEATLVREAGVDAGAGFLGSFSGVDGFSMVKGAPNPDASYELLNHSMTRDVQLAVAEASSSVPVIELPEDQLPPLAKEFGGLTNIIQNAPIMGSVPAEGADGLVGFKELGAVWNEFKASL